MAHEPHTIPCQDSTIGRRQTTTVRLDDESGRAVVIGPQPAATYDWWEIGELIDALTKTREEMRKRGDKAR